ncbi:uncharacterized protein LOC126722231 [Quercus robur]|uniref:uncharacterized protein LOC126722231 n=1 Tax=Quercus robur TaxID=38942 RepID=UPI0021630C6A|nr:uncharacterized protein LOC126722231 [Quercus robur]
MRSFLKGRMLWHYCTGAITIPVKGASEEDAVFLGRMIEWDSHNHMILTWIRNTSIPSIFNLLDSFDDAKSAWDMLAKSFASFWDQIDLSDPTWACSKDAQQYASIRDEFRLYEFLMSLHKDFEPIRGQLLNRNPAPSLDTAVNELGREEARLATLQAQNKLNVLAITPSTPLIEQPQQSSDSSGSNNRRKQTNKKVCNYCKRSGHTIETCYRCNKSTTAVANTEPTLPMASTSAESQSSGSTINLSPTELQEIIAQAVRMAAAAVSSLPSLTLWHSRLGHAPSSRVQQLASRGLLRSVSKDNFDCTSYESLVPSTNTFDPPLDFSPDIFDASPRQVEDEQAERD